MAPTFAIALAMMTLIGLTDTVWGAARGTIMQMITPDNFRGRVMGVFQLSNRGLHPLGQVESGLLIPLIGVRETTLFGGILSHRGDALNRLESAGDSEVPLG